MKFFQQKQGFTLIEILIVISVIAIISVTGIAALSTFQTNQLMNVTAKDLVSTLNLAKSRARTQVKPKVCIDPEPDLVLDGYGVRLCSSVFLPGCGSDYEGYELYVKCGGNVITTALLSKKMPSGYEFKQPGTTGDFFFPVLEGGVEADGDIIIDNMNGLTKTISVDASGNIEIQ